MKILSLVLLTLPFLAIAESFQKGTGSQFVMTAKGQSKVDLNIYVSESSFTRLGIEYYFAVGNGLFKTQMWQQYIFKIVDNGPLNIEAGYIKTPELDKSETLTEEYFHTNKGVQVNDFIFSKRSEINKYKIGQETIEVPAGSLIATHYQKKNNGQTVDFWISDIVKPIGLVKLISRNPKISKQNYLIELKSLLKNVKSEIDPKKSVPLSKKGKELLASPSK